MGIVNFSSIMVFSSLAYDKTITTYILNFTTLLASRFTTRSWN